MMSKEHRIYKVDRRDFLKKTGMIGAGSFLLGMQFSCSDKSKFLTGNSDTIFSPNVYMSINGMGEVTLIAHRSEMGTGIRTSLPLIMADELEADWEKVKLKQAIGDAQYGDQNTDGSYSVRMFYTQLRKAGATVRLMLEKAAAEEWKVDVSECKAENHKVVHKNGAVFGFGYLAEKANNLPIPDATEISLKDPKDFKYISRKTSIYDLEDIVTGKAKFGFDKNIPHAKVALIKRNPEPGAGWKSYDDKETLAVSGVRKVFSIEASGFPTGHEKPLGGIVVVADNTWSAMKGREALKVVWNKGRNGSYDSERNQKEMLGNANRAGNIKREQGNVGEAFKKSEEIIEVDYLVPHLSHAPMETPCAVALFDSEKNSCEVWAPVQAPQWTRRAVSAVLDLKEDAVTVNVTLLGGAFGRKSKPDFVCEAALISKEIAGPIKLLWTREDDIQHDYYHFPSAQHMKIGLDATNKVNAWMHRTVFPPIGGTGSLEEKEASSAEISMGMVDMPYDIANVCCETQEAPAKIRIGWLRSVANIHHAFAVGSTLDQIAISRGVDAAQNLLDLLGEDRNIDFESLSSSFWNYNEKIEEFPWNTTRYRNVIETIRDKSNWGKSMPKGSGIGIAAHRSFLTYVACVVEVEVRDDGSIKIPMVHYAVDCGVPVNPDRIKSQFEGGAAFGASLALKSEITVKNGAVQESNFDNYFVARMTDAPYETAVHIIESNEKPTGVGEPPVPPFIPALCNAIYAATGKRITKLPIDLG